MVFTPDFQHLIICQLDPPTGHRVVSHSTHRSTFCKINTLFSIVRTFDKVYVEHSYNFDLTQNDDYLRRAMIVL